jgi:hypothetical protein
MITIDGENDYGKNTQIRKKSEKARFEGLPTLNGSMPPSVFG